MSAIICHYFHGVRSLGEKSSYSKEQQDAFLLGLQGPALFAYSLLFSKAQEDARDLCNGLSTLSLEVLFRSAQQHKGEEGLSAYCLGLQCYCVLEEEVFPFIQYSEEMVHCLNPGQTATDSKNQVESALDIILLRYETAMLPTKFDLRKTVPLDATLCRVVASFYQQLATEALGQTVSVEELESLIADGCKSIGKLNDRTLMKRQFLKRKEKKQGKTGGLSSLFRNISEDEDYDYANICENEWQWPLETGEVRTEQYFDLYEMAVKKAATLFQ